MTVRTHTSVQATTRVQLPAAEAFALFTEDIGTWWNPDHHIIEAPLSHMVFEPYVGGNVYDVGTDGSECRWSRVLVYEPPHRVIFSWDINAQWQIESDHDRCSEVEVTFTEDSPGTTSVVLEHRHLDRHGDALLSQIEDMRTGWQEGLIDLYAEAAAQRR